MFYSKGGIVVKNRIKILRNKINSISGWSQIVIMLVLLIVILFVTIVEYSLFQKNTKLSYVFEKVFTEGYGTIMYFNYIAYVLCRMALLIVPTVGMALFIKFVHDKNELNVYRSKKRSAITLYGSLILWCVFIECCFAYKIYFEANYLNQPVLSNWVGLCQMYEVIVPALALTFVDDSFSDIRNEKKMKQRKKLLKPVEQKAIKVFSEGGLSEKEQLHLLNNLEKQKAKLLKNRY